MQRHTGDRDTLETTIRNLRDEATRLTEEHRQTSTRVDTLRSEVGELELRATALQAQLRELGRRGYTDEIVSQIIAGDAASASELLRRVATLGEYETQIHDA